MAVESRYKFRGGMMMAGRALCLFFPRFWIRYLLAEGKYVIVGSTGEKYAGGIHIHAVGIVCLLRLCPQRPLAERVIRKIEE